METLTQISVGSRRRIAPNEIILFTADANYTQIMLANGRTITVATTLKILEKRFAVCSDFFRTHKSYLININHIKQFETSGNEVFVQMQNDIRVIVSRRKKQLFKKRISSIFEMID